MAENFVNIGGQAVIEGVMMRSEKYISVACRLPNGKIALQRKPNLPWSKRIKLFKLPIFRGCAVLFESLIHGMKALTWSADLAIEAEEDKATDKKSKNQKAKKESDSNVSMIMTVIWGLAMGMALFFWLPLYLTELTGVTGGFMFNLIDGGIRLGVFLLYIGAISLWKEVRTIYEYHGAEHKSIYALEKNCPLNPEGAKEMSRLHPRCGTSFLLIVMVVSIIVFVFLGKPITIADRLIRFLFLPVIGGFSYEIIKLSSKFMNNPIAKILILPGLWMQKITTKEPTMEQLEVGMVALRSAMGESMIEDNIIHYDSDGKVATKGVEKATA